MSQSPVSRTWYKADNFICSWQQFNPRSVHEHEWQYIRQCTCLAPVHFICMEECPGQLCPLNLGCEIAWQPSAVWPCQSIAGKAICSTSKGQLLCFSTSVLWVAVCSPFCHKNRCKRQVLTGLKECTSFDTGDGLPTTLISPCKRIIFQSCLFSSYPIIA